jgi:hypothetical protein
MKNDIVKAVFRKFGQVVEVENALSIDFERWRRQASTHPVPESRLLPWLDMVR